MFACFLYVGMLLLAPIAACDVLIPVFDCVMDLNVFYSLLVPVLLLIAMLCMISSSVFFVRLSYH